ncbi:hypothetical protein [Bacillus sp. P14.5]|uniref:hypothetical protein n=1 Tax=Bacillus sp. P14.5 TaxID=1983400 RepID=UPI000DE9BE21|nr:hypothetical protein [Bacillus sp. P14.5]
MNQFIERIKAFSKNLTYDIADAIHEHTSEKIPFSDISEAITSHEKTKHTMKKLLENVYHSYELDLSPYFIKLETKGEQNEFILQLTISSQEKMIYSFRSYDESPAYQEIISVPAPLWEKINDPLTQKNIH